MGDLTKNFSRSEFKCPCGCGSETISHELVQKLQQARSAIGKPFKINSGVRCLEHNAAVGGVDSSAHVGGYAADISCTNSSDRYMLQIELLKAGFQRIGIASKFIHVDIDPSKPKKVLWKY